uniref:Uncharacterized protein n=1 Tax=Triticum urartu TaxID=4572 RepID=A0A8R7Q3C3_TRIUA
MTWSVKRLLGHIFVQYTGNTQLAVNMRLKKEFIGDVQFRFESVSSVLFNRPDKSRLFLHALCFITHKIGI